MKHLSRALVIGALPAELTMRQVAQHTGVRTQTVRNWARAKPPLPNYPNDQGVAVVSLAVLRTWLGLDTAYEPTPPLALGGHYTVTIGPSHLDDGFEE